MRSVALLPRRVPIRLQEPIDECWDRLERGPHPLLRWLLHRNRASHRLAHEPSMDSELPGYPGDRSYPEFVFPPDLFEEFYDRFPPAHLAFPLAVLVCPQGTPCSLGGWATLHDRHGPT